MRKNIWRNISKNVSGKYNPGMLAVLQKVLDNAKQSVTDMFKTASKRAIQKTAEATGDLIGYKIGKKITKVPKILQQNNSEAVTNEHAKEIHKERYISRRKTRNYWWTDIKIIIKFLKNPKKNNS